MPPPGAVHTTAISIQLAAAIGANNVVRAAKPHTHTHTHTHKQTLTRLAQRYVGAGFRS